MLAETKVSFSEQVAPERLPGLAKIFYDGIAKQVRATVSGIVMHRAVFCDHPTLAAQQRNWTQALVAQNQVFLNQIRQAGASYPERIVVWNRRLSMVRPRA